MRASVCVGPIKVRRAATRAVLRRNEAFVYGVS
jgi:hypothetical protein